MEIFAEIARFLEELVKMSLAVQDSVHGWVVAHLPYASSTVYHTMSIVSTICDLLIDHGSVAIA